MGKARRLGPHRTVNSYTFYRQPYTGVRKVFRIITTGRCSILVD